jgi:predicted lipoprotein with Yx(FWY)xxD motif
MKKQHIIALSTLAALTALTACGGSDAAKPSATTVAAVAPTAAPTTTVADAYPASPPETTAAPAAPAAPLVGVADNALGQLLAGADGRTLYGLTKDADGTPTCVGGCAAAWPPVVVDDSLDLSSLPSSGSFSIVDRSDGTKQLKAGKWPLYYFSGDTAAGEANGQASGGVWFVVAPDAKLIK